MLVAGALLARGCPEEPPPPPTRVRQPRPPPDPQPEPILVVPLVAAIAIPKPVVEEPPPPPTPPPPPEPPPPVLIKHGWAYGVVRFLGEGPPRKTFRHGRSKVPSEEFVVNGEGGVKWAFVYVGEGVKEDPPEVSEKVVELEIRGGRFNPHVLGLRVQSNYAFTDPFTDRGGVLLARSCANQYAHGHAFSAYFNADGFPHSRGLHSPGRRAWGEHCGHHNR